MVSSDIYMVGFDGSAGALRALDWAAAEAARHGGTIRVVACFTAPMAAEPWYVAPAVDIDRLADDTIRYVRAAVAPLQQRHPSVRFELMTRMGPAAAELVDAARGSALLVVGRRGNGRFDAWRLGSVAHAVARHGPCPVGVVPDVEPAAEHARIVVGVDGSAGANAALRWACREADRREAELCVVHGWEYPYATEVGSLEARDLTQIDAALVLEDAVRTAREAYSGPVQGRLVQGRVASELVAAAREADLLVVGSRGRGAFRALLFGSVSHEVTTHAACPIVVVRDGRDDGHR